MSINEIEVFSHYTYIAEIIKNLFFIVAIWKISRQHKISPIHQSQVPYLDMDMN